MMTMDNGDDDVKILAIGDLHFKADNSEQTYRLCTEICKLIKTECCDLSGVVVLGDILHRHDKIDLFSYHRATRFLMSIRAELDRLEKKDSKVRTLFILIGNHDRPNNTTFLTDEHAFTSAKLWKDTVVVDKPFEYETTNKKRFLFVPYVQPGRFFEALKEEDFDYKKYNCIFAHQEFKGCKLGPIVSTEGDEYPLDAPLCVSGHIHEFSKPQPNIIYVGTPFKSCWQLLSSSSSSRTATTTTPPFVDEGSVSFFEFTKDNDDIKHYRKKINGIPFNVSILFNSKFDFFESVQKARYDDDETSIKSVKRPLIYNILKQKGFEEEKLKDVNLVKIKIKCSSREEFLQTVFNSQERIELSHEGVSIVSDVVSSISHGKSCFDDTIQEEERQQQQSKTFHEELVDSFKNPETQKDVVDFFVKTFPEFKSDFS